MVCRGYFCQCVRRNTVLLLKAKLPTIFDYQVQNHPFDEILQKRWTGIETQELISLGLIFFFYTVHGNYKEEWKKSVWKKGNGLGKVIVKLWKFSGSVLNWINILLKKQWELFYLRPSAFWIKRILHFHHFGIPLQYRYNPVKGLCYSKRCIISSLHLS